MERGKWTALIFDVCSRPIEQVRLGMVKWDRENGTVIVCHKEKCETASDANNRPKWPWVELGVHLIFLGQNMKMDFKQQIERAERLDAIQFLLSACAVPCEEWIRTRLSSSYGVFI